MSDELEERLKLYKEKLDFYIKRLQELEDNETMTSEERFDMLVKILDEINNEKTK